MRTLHFKTVYLLCIILAGLLVSCGERECAHDATRQYNVALFTSIEVGDQHKLFITRGDQYSVRATGCEDDINEVNVEVSGQKLKISYDSFKKWHSGLTFYITMPHFDGAWLSGEAEAHAGGFLDTTSKVFDLSGQSSCTYLGHAAATVANISGQSRLEMQGVLRKLQLDVSGQSEFNGYGMLHNQVTGAVVSGQSKVYILTNGVLNADVSGQSSLHYRGNPSSTNLHSSGQSHIVHE